MKGIWVTWEFQRRNVGLSAALGWPLVQIEVGASRPIRYLVSLWKTIKSIIKQNPDVMAVQNPSIVLSVSAVFLSKIFNCKLIIDAHNSGLFPCEGESVVLMAITNWVHEKADLVIVTNGTLRNLVNYRGGRAVVLPDKIPTPPVSIVQNKLEGRVNLAVICTYSNDEPYREIIEAAGMIEDDIVLHFTGRYENKVIPKDLPGNVRLLGFIAEDEYWVLLESVDIVIDLTRRDDCLVCGAYEAVALYKPLILSNTKALKEYFNQGCVYVDLSSKSIAVGIKEAVGRLEVLRKEIVALHNDIDKKWAKKIQYLINEINLL